MVATVSKRANIVLGKSAAVNAKFLTPPEWIEIIAAAISELPMEYLHGLRSLKQILNDRGHEDKLPQVCSEEIYSALAVPAGYNVFATCGELLWGPWMKSCIGIIGEKPRDWNSNPDMERLLLLGRKREEASALFVLESRWQRVQSKTPGRLSGSRYEAIEVRIEPITLENIFTPANDRCREIGMEILRTLYYAQRDTTAHFAARCADSRTKQYVFKGYLQRLRNAENIAFY